MSGGSQTVETIRGLLEAWGRLCEHPAWDGCEISLTRTRNGDIVIFAHPDFVDAAGMDAAVNAGRELELSVALTENTVRIEPHTSDTVQRVEQVKRVLQEDKDSREDERENGE